VWLAAGARARLCSGSLNRFAFLMIWIKCVCVVSCRVGLYTMLPLPIVRGV